MRKKFILFLMIFFFLFVLADFGLAKKCSTDPECGKGARCIETKPGEKKCVRALEVVYPKTVGGKELTEEKIIEEGLPGYVKYIFTLSVGLIGFVIFGLLIYNGVIWLSSAGNPTLLTKAREGIIAAGLGGIILLFSVLIFNTINPQLAILELPKIEVLSQVIPSGIYICNYNIAGAEIKVGDEKITIANIAEFENILNDYIDEGSLAEAGTPAKKEEIEKRNKAAQKIRAIITKGCPRVFFSGNFENFQVTKDKTIFIIPYITEDWEAKTRTAEYIYGIVLHENDNFGGKCDYFPRNFPGISADFFKYDQIVNFSAGKLGLRSENFDVARSVTLFQKPPEDSTGEGVTLYSCLNYDKEVSGNKCQGGKKDFIKKDLIPAKNFVLAAGSSMLEDLLNNTRSIRIDGPYFALLFEGDNLNGRCKLLNKNHPNLLDVLPTDGNCGFKTWWQAWDWFQECYARLGSIIVIKGSVL